MINVAYLDPTESGNYEFQDFEKRRPQNPHSLAVMAAFDDATVGWNNARYRALLITPAKVAATIPELDQEVDRLLELAHAQAWTRAEFRQERITLGRMAADYLRLARNLAGLPDIELFSIWTWDSGNIASATEQEDASSAP